MYVDESGDTGHNNSQAQYFVLSGIVLHEDSWLNMLSDLVDFRRYLRRRYGLGMREEIHAAEWLNRNPNLRAKIPKYDRLDILKKCLKWLNQRDDISIYSVRCDKHANLNKDIFTYTWSVFIQEFEDAIVSGNFQGNHINEKGIVISDNTQGQKLANLLREMRQHNFIPDMKASYNISAVIEDPIMRDSSDSYFHQMVDIVAFFARMYYEPNRYTRRKGARTYYNFLGAVINSDILRKTNTKPMVEIKKGIVSYPG